MSIPDKLSKLLLLSWGETDISDILLAVRWQEALRALQTIFQIKNTVNVLPPFMTQEVYWGNDVFWGFRDFLAVPGCSVLSPAAVPEGICYTLCCVTQTTAMTLMP